MGPVVEPAVRILGSGKRMGLPVLGPAKLRLIDYEEKDIYLLVIDRVVSLSLSAGMDAVRVARDAPL